MKYAIVTTGSHQFKVSEGDEVLIDRVSGEVDSNYAFPGVLLIVDESKRSIGKPEVEGAKVTGKILSHDKGEKLRVSKFKAKARYRRVKGYRHSYSKIKIESISA